MSTFPIAVIAAVSTLLPISILAALGRLERNALGWFLLAAAVAGGVAPALVELGGGWRTGLAASLHVTAAACLIVFAASAVLNAATLRLAALVGPYVLLLVLLGALVLAMQAEPPMGAAPGAWFAGHVLLSIGAYAALTLSAIAACGVLLLERAFKARVESWATRVLPPLSETEGLQNALLKLAAILLLLALATGAANELLIEGQPLAFTHKILLSFLGFAVVLILLVLHHRTGLRGRRAARWLLTGYLLVTLAYPGVKFVQEVLIG